MAGEKKGKLKDVCSKIGSGATPRGGKEAYKGGETTLIRSQNVYNEGFHRDGLVNISDQQAAELKNVELRSGDVLLNITGDSVARCCQVEDAVLPARVNQHVAIIRPRMNELDARFLRYVLISPALQSHLLSLASAGATRNAITKAMIENLHVPIPPLPEQKRIAHILGTLDDKIELNRRMNATLEGMAQALFKSWFIDFDPVIDNILVKNMAKCSDQNQPSPPAPLPGVEGSSKSPRPLGEDLGEGAIFDGIPEEFMGRAEIRRQALADGTANREAAKHFPSAFQFTKEVGWIPEGWKEAKLNDLLDVKYGKDHKKLAEGSIPVYGSGGLMRYAEKALYSGESVLIPRKGTLSNILYLNEKFWTVDTMFYTTPKCKYVLKYAFYHLKSLDFASMNVGSAVPSMTTKVLNALPIVMPAESSLHNFGSSRFIEKII